MNLHYIKNRFHAFFIHLACSAIVAFLVIAVVFLVWYPGVLATVTGVTEIFFLVLVVDVCLGPLLTLIVFDVRKKELSRDLLIILLFQISALFYGIYTVGVVRPAYVVFAIDRFELVYADELTEDKLKLVSNDEYKSVPFLGPKWVSARPPKDVSERNKLIFQALEGGDDFPQLPQYYLPYSESKEEVINRLKPLEDLKKFNLANLGNYENMINRYSSALSEYGFLPLKADTMDIAVVIDKYSAEVVEMVELRPWP